MTDTQNFVDGDDLGSGASLDGTRYIDLKPENTDGETIYAKPEDNLSRLDSNDSSNDTSDTSALAECDNCSIIPLPRSKSFAD